MKQEIVKRAEYIAWIKSQIAENRLTIKDIEGDIGVARYYISHSKEIRDRNFKRVSKAELRILRRRLRRERKNLKDMEVLLFIAENKFI
jgi:hypothetical protein